MFLADISLILGRLGLKAGESQIYLACLTKKVGLRTQNLVELTKIKRSTVNLILDRLLAKGFLTYHLEGSRRVFTAQPPEHLLYEAESTVSDLRSIIPLLLTQSGGQPSSKVRFYEGREEVWKIYNDQILTLTMDKNPRRELLAISSGKDVFKVMPAHQRQFIDRRVKERIPIRWIAPDGDYARSFLEDAGPTLRQMKFFDPATYPFKIEVDVYSHKVALTNLDETKPSGFIIENLGIADSMRSLFNLLWDLMPAVSTTQNPESNRP